MTSFDKIGLWVTLLINKVKVVFAKTMRNSLIISHYQSHYVRILVGVPKNYRTERLLAERLPHYFRFNIRMYGSCARQTCPILPRQETFGNCGAKQSICVRCFFVSTRKLNLCTDATGRNTETLFVKK